MDFLLVLRHLGAVAYVIGIGMCLCLPWSFGQPPENLLYERAGFLGMCGSIVVSFATAITLRIFGRKSTGELFQKEAIAVVVLSWVLATALGTLPYLFSGVSRSDGVRMSVSDAVFESISGYSTCGATVLANVESSSMIPRSVLFWRAMTHFIGGIGILTILTVLAGQGARRKTVVRAEMVSIVSGKPKVPVYRLAGIVLAIYISLNLLLTVTLCICGVPLYDSLAHAFSTISTGGFSTYNSSVGYFAANTKLNAAFIEYAVTLFMLMAGTNFLLYYWVVIGKPGVLLKNEEWRAFLGIYIVASVLIFSSGLYHSDFKAQGIGEKTLVEGANPEDDATFALSARYVLFTTASILTNTGFATYEYEKWNPFSCFILLTLFFAGGCAGSTSGSIKVIRHIVCWKLIKRKIELTFRPNLVKPIVANGNEIEVEDQRNILIFFVAFMVIFVAMTIFVLALEPSSKWTAANLSPENKALDVASSVAACLSNTGPGLGIVGAKQNYGNFSEMSKILFSFAMLLGRLEIFIVLTLFVPNFWRRIQQ